MRGFAGTSDNDYEDLEIFLEARMVDEALVVP